jgi:oligopeptide/dipeptide ABC transporter ATP-binding protein
VVLLNSDSIVSIENLSVKLMTTRGVVCAVRGVDLEIRKGEIHGLVGESGCGKTMTAKSIMRLHDENRTLYDGRILLNKSDGTEVSILDIKKKELQSIRGSEIAMIFQDPMASLNPLLTIGDQIGEMLQAHTELSAAQIAAKTLELLDMVGIKPAEERSRQYPFEFSGGMAQRIMIAMALSCEPQLLISDEATTALDVTTQAQILDLLKDLQRRIGMSILLITHNFGVVAEICDRTSVMYAGKIVETSSVQELFDAPQHPYTKALINSIPRSGRAGERLVTIPGAPPSLLKPIKGCAFAPRCQYAMDKCSQEPKLSIVQSGHGYACHLSDGREEAEHNG